MTDRDKFCEILPALIRFCQQGHVAIALATRYLFFFVLGRRTEVNFATENRFHARLFTSLVKFNRTKEIAVIGHRYSWHTQFRGPLCHICRPCHAIQGGIFSVEMEMNEGVRHGARSQ